MNELSQYMLKISICTIHMLMIHTLFTIFKNLLFREKNQYLWLKRKLNIMLIKNNINFELFQKHVIWSIDLYRVYFLL